MTNARFVDLYNSGIHIEVAGYTVGEIKIPSDYVPLTFAPILGQHQFLTGDKLENGMIVVIDGGLMRANPNSLSPEYPDRKNGYVPSEYDRARVEETARWAVVTDLNLERDLVEFTAIYSDGTMRDRRYAKSYKWAVLSDFEFIPICPFCKVVHEDVQTVSEDPEGQPFYDLMDAAADLAGSFLFPEGKTKEERITAVKNMLSGTVADLKEELNSIFTEQDLDDSEAEEGIRDGETPDEYADRLRDEAEIANEYDANEALAALREKLTGVPRPTR